MNFVKPTALNEQANNEFHAQKVGDSSKELLSDDRFTSLKVEIQYMAGFKPDSVAVDHLRGFLRQYLHKPRGIIITTNQIAPAKDTILTISEVESIEKANRTAYTKQNEITVYILYTNGHYADSMMLGYAYRNTSVVLFGNKIRESSNASNKPARTYLETRTFEHELSHLLGLVNVGTPDTSDHKDDHHGSHCINKKCLMYFLTNIRQLAGFRLDSEVPVLDKECVDDLRANGGR